LPLTGKHQFLFALKHSKTDYFIKLKGRTKDEEAFITVTNGLYTGYGFIPNDLQFYDPSSLDFYTIPQQNTPETQRLVESFARKNPSKVITIKKESVDKA